MRTEPWYVDQSTHNQEISNVLNKLVYQSCDWEITTMFYSALHLTNEYLIQQEITMPTNHKVRNGLIKSLLLPIYPEYQKLFYLSQRSRYLVKYDRMTDADVITANKYFEVIYNYVTVRI